MRVLLISANTEPINMPILPVGLGAVATATRNAGHEMELVDLMRADDTRGEIETAVERLRPDVIGIGVRNIDDQNRQRPLFLLDQVKEVISICRTVSEAPVVLGGAGYSIFPDSALKYLGADMGIQGEGEISFPELLTLLEKGTDLSGATGLYLPGLGVQQKRKFVKILDDLALPDISLWPPFMAQDQDLWVPIQSRRGCPIDCSYCSTSTIEGRIIRKFSPERIVHMIESYVARGFQRFFFVDNTFNMPPAYAKRLCSALLTSAVDISWRCIVYPGRIDEKLVEMMARAGCKDISLGFESGCARILRRMNKKFDPEAVRRASKLIGDHGIRRMGFLLLGGPGETKQSVEESLAFADSLQLEAMKITVGIRIYPHTALSHIARREGVFSDTEDLLFPRFYMAKGMEDWLPETVQSWMIEHPNWIS